MDGGELKATHYGNGDPVPHITDNAQWAALTTGAYGEYDNDEDHVGVYGRLYNAYAVQDIRGLCPQGWHVPTDEEWIKLEMSLGMSSSEAKRMTAWRGKNEGHLLKSADFGGRIQRVLAPGGPDTETQEASTVPNIPTIITGRPRRLIIMAP